jgi:hypothetical protein
MRVGPLYDRYKSAWMRALRLMRRVRSLDNVTLQRAISSACEERYAVIAELYADEGEESVEAAHLITEFESWLSEVEKENE